MFAKMFNCGIFLVKLTARILFSNDKKKNKSGTWKVSQQIHMVQNLAGVLLYPASQFPYWSVPVEPAWYVDWL